MVIKPAWDLHPAALLPVIAPLSVWDGEGHLPVPSAAQQPVPGGLRGDRAPSTEERTVLEHVDSGTFTGRRTCRAESRWPQTSR